MVWSHDIFIRAEFISNISFSAYSEENWHFLNIGLVNQEEIQIPPMAPMLFMQTKYCIVLAFCMLKLAAGEDFSVLNMRAVKKQNKKYS